MAAIASSIARPPDGDDDRTAGDRGDTGAGGGRTTVVEPAPDTPEPTTIEFEEAARPQTRELEADRPATVVVEVDTPGQVGIPSLGLTAPAEPLTPAMFELLVDDAGSHAITVRPAGSEARPSRVGTLRVVPAS